MFEINRIGLLHITAGEHFHQLGDNQKAGSSVGMEYIEWGVTIDQ